MELAKNALSIFIRSLPVDCKFSILSFGSYYEAMEDKAGDTSMSYNDATKDLALNLIAGFDSDFGGTEILMPLLSA